LFQQDREKGLPRFQWIKEKGLSKKKKTRFCEREKERLSYTNFKREKHPCLKIKEWREKKKKRDEKTQHRRRDEGGLKGGKKRFLQGKGLFEFVVGRWQKKGGDRSQGTGALEKKGGLLGEAGYHIPFVAGRGREDLGDKDKELPLLKDDCA